MFHIGQRVVAIKDHSEGAFKKGDEFCIRAISIGCNHHPIVLAIGAKIGDNTWCEFCHTNHNGYDSERFSPIISNEFGAEICEEIEKEFVEEKVNNLLE